MSNYNCPSNENNKNKTVWRTGKIVFDESTAEMFLDANDGKRYRVPDSATVRYTREAEKSVRYIRKLFRDPENKIRGRRYVVKEVEIPINSVKEETVTGELYFAKDYYVKKNQLKYEYQPMILIPDKSSEIIPIAPGTTLSVLFRESSSYFKEKESANPVLLMSRRITRDNVEHKLFARVSTSFELWIESTELDSYSGSAHSIITLFESFTLKEAQKLSERDLEKKLNFAHHEYLAFKNEGGFEALDEDKE